VIAAVIAACGLAAVASYTRPFTLSADVVTAIPLATMLVAQIVGAVRARSRRRGATAGGPSGGPSDGPSGGPSDGPSGGQPAISTVESLPFRRFIPWVAMFVVVVAFELLVFFEQPRQAHPTLSSLSDDLTRWHVGKAALFIAWLALGWLLLRRRVQRRVDRHVDRGAETGVQLRGSAGS
jgi:hypothetical protein